VTTCRRILIISQVFWPDSSSVSQQMTDLAEGLSRHGHRIEVLSSRFAYENSGVRFAVLENRFGVRIRRLWQTRFKKSSRWGRVLNYLTFNASFLARLLFVRRKKTDLIIGTTLPPLGPFFCTVFGKIKNVPFALWAMDLQPELAILAGYLKKMSLIAKILQALSDYTYKNSDLIIALDKYMAHYIQKRVGRIRQTVTIPPWPVHTDIYVGQRLDNPFRMQQGFKNKIVIMYSGNHSVMHPLETLLKAAFELRQDDRFLFVFIGAGIRKTEVIAYKNNYGLSNVLALPLQDRDNIHNSLSSADIHAVIEGDGCAGLTHPSKIYGAMSLGKPILYIGPIPSHITDILENCPGNFSLRHGEIDALIKSLHKFSEMSEQEWTKIGSINRIYAKSFFSREISINRICDCLEKLIFTKKNHGKNSHYGS